MISLRDYGLLACLLAICMTAACGIKPHRLEQPQGSPKNDFPRHYPMPDGSFDQRKK